MMIFSSNEVLERRISRDYSYEAFLYLLHAGGQYGRASCYKPV